MMGFGLKKSFSTGFKSRRAARMRPPPPACDEA
jgi:hypothetical protein